MPVIVVRGPDNLLLTWQYCMGTVKQIRFKSIMHGLYLSFHKGVTCLIKYRDQQYQKAFLSLRIQLHSLSLRPYFDTIDLSFLAMQ